MKMSVNHLKRKRACIMAIFVIIASFTLTLTLPIFLVRANPLTLTVSPTSGNVGSTVTLSGDDATAYGEVRVYMATFFTGLFVATTTANSTGGYSVNITVPTYPAGANTILVRDVSSGDEQTALFTINPDINVAPGQGSAEDIVTVNGDGFSGERLINVTFDGVDVTPTLEPPRTDPFGSFQLEVRVPEVPQGTYTINASDGVNIALASFTVIPKISVNPTSGTVSTLVFVDGTGYAASSMVTMMFGDVNVTMQPSIPTDANGSFMQIFFVPDVANGTHIINATDATAASATAPFLVPSATLTLEPNATSGPSLVTAKGLGFPPGQPVLLYLQDRMMVELIDLIGGTQALLADEYGAYEYSFVIPVETPGVYRVVAYSLTGPGFAVGNELASASLTIVADATLVDIQDQIATIIIPDLGIVKENLTAINAELVGLNGTTATINSTLGMMQTDIDNIDLNIVAISGDTATIQTSLGTIEGKITQIEGDMAVIETDLGTVVIDTSDLRKNQETFTTPMYIGLALTSIAAAGTVFLAILHVRALRKTD